MVKLAEHPELMLKATDNNTIIGVLLDNFIKTIPSTYYVSWREDKEGESKAIIETQTLDKALQQRANTHNTRGGLN